LRSAPPHLLLINPWIHDFAAYDFWAKPLGLLTLAAILRQAGVRVSYIDCLDRFHPKAPPSDPAARHGRGPYRKTRLPNPSQFPDVARRFARYGVDPAWLREDLRTLGRPDLILVTSSMTYWYTGVRETVASVKDVYPQVPLVLGGVYASLCPDHARRCSGADEIFTGPGEPAVLALVAAHTGWAAAPGFGWHTVFAPRRASSRRSPGIGQS